MKRYVALLAAATAGASLMPMTASAAPEDVSVFRFRGRGGSAILTDCPTGAPAGTRCRAVDVFAFEERINNDGERVSGEGVGVTLFEVTIIATDPFFEAVAVGSGFTNDATVNIATSLLRGSASADEVPLCEEFPCAPGAQQTLSIEVDWDGFGPRENFRSRQRSTDGFCTTREQSNGASRAADATGVVDGVDFVEPNLPQFQARLFSDRFGAIQRCPTS